MELTFDIEGELKLISGNSILELPVDIGDALYEAGHKRLLCTLNGHPIHIALNRRKGGSSYFIRIGKKHLKVAKQEREGSIRVRVEPDTSEHQFATSPILDEVLGTDPEALEIWQTFTPGRKRSFIAYVTMVKSTDLRIERALKIAERIKRGQTNPRDIGK